MNLHDPDILILTVAKQAVKLTQLEDALDVLRYQNALQAKQLEKEAEEKQDG